MKQIKCSHFWFLVIFCSSAGSLNVAFNMEINTAVTPDYETSAASAMGDLASSGLAVGGVILAASNVQVNIPGAL